MTCVCGLGDREGMADSRQDAYISSTSPQTQRTWDPPSLSAALPAGHKAKLFGVHHIA